MKQLLIILFILVIAGCTDKKGPVGGDSPEHLLKLFLQYHKDKDIENMMLLYNMDGAPDGIKKLQKRKLKMIFDMNLQEAQIESLDEASISHFNSEIKTHGQTIAYNTHVDHQLMTTYSGNRAEALLFGTKGERYYFALHTYK